MSTVNQVFVTDAFTSMLRTDYIALNDNEKLAKLANYYVDHFGYLPQILTDSDQLIVGRRGTGKTTLMYRALVECMRTWTKTAAGKPRTLGIYIDLSKCSSLFEKENEQFDEFEHVFISEVCDALVQELHRSWPALGGVQDLLARLFGASERRRADATNRVIEELGQIISSGIPRLAVATAPTKVRELRRQTGEVRVDAELQLGPSGPAGKLGTAVLTGGTTEKESERGFTQTSRLTIADVLRKIGALREAAGMGSIYLLLDEFSALNDGLQRRLSTLLKKLMGSHHGVYVKVCAITDNFTLGSAIILQRDMFELSLDLDAFVERSGSLGSAMKGLAELAERIVTQRLQAYAACRPEDLIEHPESEWIELSRSAMGVPRTIGIVLKNAWGRAQSASRRRISRSDIDYGIRSASRSYLNQLLGASRDGVALPRYVSEIWDDLLTRAIEEKGKSDGSASHFMVLARNQERVRFLATYFLIHLIQEGRTTKKESYTRSLYCFDYGICLENNLGFELDKNVIRQQRFAYDFTLEKYDRFFQIDLQESYLICPKCQTVYKEKDMVVGGVKLTFCPKDRKDLEEYKAGGLAQR